VSDCFLPRLGGIEVQVDELSRAQAALGHDVTVATATPGPFTGAGNPEVRRLTLPLPWELPVGGSITALLDRVKPDVVHVHTGVVSPFAWRAIHRARRAGVPVVVTVHSLWGTVSGLGYRMLFAAWGDGLVVTTVSEAAAVPIRRVVRGRIPVETISNGIDVECWRQTRPWLPTGHVHVVAVGRLAPRKEPMTLLKLLREVRRQTPIRATVVGDGPARRAMERYVRRHRMEGWLCFAGRLDRSEVREVLATADIFLAPAARESFGLAALEARLAGVPVVGRAGSGVADFVTSGREGLLGHDRAELSAALLRLATDHDLRDAVAVHNRSGRPVRCTWPAVLEAFAECYERAGGRISVRGHGRG
jgi:glycosyltransferase involved in cell wall biosynthesis